MPDMQHLVKKRQKLNPSIISQQSPHNTLVFKWDTGSSSHIQSLYLPYTPISNVRHNKWHKQPPPNLKRCMQCGLKVCKIQYTFWHIFLKWSVKTKPRLLTLKTTLITSDHISSVGENINPATTNHYYMTLYRIQLKNIRSCPFMHTLQI
jgi:hypothetical protein